MNWRASRPCVVLIGLAWVSGSAFAADTARAVKLIYKEFEQGVQPYQVTYTISAEHLRIDDDADQSGFIVFDSIQHKIFSVSHYDNSILVIANDDAEGAEPELQVDIEYKPIEGAPRISGRPVYNYRVKAVTDTSSETCTDIQLVPGLFPKAAALLQLFQQRLSAQQLMNLAKTPEELRTPCYLVDQVYNTGEYYNKGLPVQEWHSNGRNRQLLNFEETEVDSSIFTVPADYRQFSLQ